MYLKQIGLALDSQGKARGNNRQLILLHQIRPDRSFDGIIKQSVNIALSLNHDRCHAPVEVHLSHDLLIGTAGNNRIGRTEFGNLCAGMTGFRHIDDGYSVDISGQRAGRMGNRQGDPVFTAWTG